MLNNWWRLPGPEKYIKNIINDIRSGKNVILCLPEIIDNGIEDALNQSIKEESEFFVKKLKYNQDKDPVEFIYEKLIPPPKVFSERNIENLISNEELKYHVIIINCSFPSLRKWSTFLKEYQHLQQNIFPIERCIICLIHHSVFPDFLPKEDACLTIHPYLNINSEIDLEFYLYQISSNENKDQSLIRKLIISIIGQLVIDDPELCAQLIQENLYTITDPVDLLNEICLKRDWPQHIKLGAIDFDSIEAKQLINYGLLGYIEGVPKFHPCFLLGSQKKNEIEKRIWSGQVRVLFPFLELTRQQILLRLENVIKIPCKKKINGIEVEINDLFELEFGDIEFQLYENIRKIKWLHENGMLELVTDLKKIRNKLSHLTPVNADLILKTYKLAGDVLHNT